MDERVTAEEINGLLLVKLNRPEKLNALSEDMWDRLGEFLDKGCNGQYKAIIITGEGRAFSSGDDIKAMYELRSANEAKRFFSKVGRAIKTLGYCVKPVIVVLNGIAVGGGAELLFLADAVIGLKGSWISYPEAHIGLIPPILLTIGTSTFGPRKVKYLALTGHRLSMEDAYTLGLIDYIADSFEDAINVAFMLAESMSKIPVTVSREIKRITMNNYQRELENAMETLISLVLSDESKRLMYNFIYRKP